MGENIVLYLTTVNLVLTGLIYLISVKLEKYRESLDDFAVYLQELREQMDKDGDGGNNDT